MTTKSTALTTDQDKGDAFLELMDTAYTATTRPEIYDDLLLVWERYMVDSGFQGDDQARAEFTIHFNRAFDILETLGRQRRSQARVQDIIDNFRAPAVVLGGELQVFHTNAAAKLALPDWSGGSGKVAVLPDRKALQKAVKAVEDGDGMQMVPVFDEEERLTNSALVCGLPKVEGQQTPWYLVALCGSQLDPEAREWLTGQFGLTDTEALVLLDLLAGHSVDRVAENKGVSVGTVRTHVRKLLEKSGTHSMTELIRLSTLILSQRQAVSLAAVAQGIEPSDRNEYQRIITPDGRVLAYRTFGAPQGRPVLFFHNMMGGAFWTKAMVDAATENGWRIIAPSRPGFGYSDSVAAKDRELIRVTCSDARALLDHLEVDQALVIGMMSSAGIGACFALDHPDRTRAFLSVGHTGRMDRQIVEAMSNPARAMAKTYFRSEVALRFLVRVAVASVDMLGPGQMLRSNFSRCEPDARLMHDPEVSDAIGRGLQHAIRQGGEAFSRDGYAALTDFVGEIERLTCPRLCVLGSEDAMYPVEQAKRLMTPLNGYDLKVIQDAGQYVFYSKFEEVLPFFEDLWARA